MTALLRRPASGLKAGRALRQPHPRRKFRQKKGGPADPPFMGSGVRDDPLARLGAGAEVAAAEVAAAEVGAADMGAAEVSGADHAKTGGAGRADAGEGCGPIPDAGPP